MAPKITPSAPITQDEWLAALEEKPIDPSARTVQELSVILGLKPRAVLTRLAKLRAQKRLHTVWKRSTNSLGVSTLIPAYILLRK